MVTLISYGEKIRERPAADLYLDVRQWADNPHALFPERDGRDAAVQAWVRKRVPLDTIVQQITQLVRQRQGHLTVAVACGYGHHRSVAMVELIRKAMPFDIPLRVKHMEL